MKRFKDIILILMAIAVFALTPLAIWVIDPTAAPFDPGLLHAIAFGLVGFFVAQAVAWFMIRIFWPRLHWYAIYHFSNDFKELSKWERLRIFLSVYFLLFALLVACMHILL